MAVMHHTIIIDIPYQKPSASLERLIKQFEKFERVIRRLKNTLAKIGGRLFDSFKTKAITAGINGIQGALQNVARWGLAAAASFITINQEAELMRARLTTIEGSVTGGEKAFQRMLQLATEMPFSIDAIVDSFAKFKAAGIQEAEKYVINLADAVAAFGGSTEDMKLATVAIQQMIGKGVLSMEEMRRQLAERIPTAFAILADKAGLSIGGLMELISDGAAMSAKYVPMLMEGFDEAYSGAAARMMATFSGSVIKLKNSWTKLMLAIGDGQGSFRAVKDVVDAASTALDKFRTSAAGAEIINKIAENIRLFLDDLANPQILQMFFTNFTEGLANVMTYFNAMEDKLAGIIRMMDFSRTSVSSWELRDEGVDTKSITDSTYMAARPGLEKLRRLIEEHGEYRVFRSDETNAEIDKVVEKINTDLYTKLNELERKEFKASFKVETDTESSVDALEAVREAALKLNQGEVIAAIEGFAASASESMVAATEDVMKLKTAWDKTVDTLNNKKLEFAEEEFQLTLNTVSAEERTKMLNTRIDELKANAASIDTSSLAGSGQARESLEQAKKLILSQKFEAQRATDEEVKHRYNAYVKLFYKAQGIHRTATQKQVETAKKLWEEADKSNRGVGEDEARKQFFKDQLAHIVEVNTLLLENYAAEEQAAQKAYLKAEELQAKYKEIFKEATNALNTFNTENTETMASWVLTLESIEQKYKDIAVAAGAAADVYIGTDSGAKPEALGGPVSGGELLMVGERGPELFVPNTNGKIVPNNKISKSSDSVNINLSLAGSKPAQLQGTPQSVADIQRAVKRYNRLAA